MMADVKRILLVEDSPNDIELTLAALAENHLANEVVVARDGEEALDYLYRRGMFKLRELGQPAVALPILRAALYLDPLSSQSQADYVAALRAQQAQQARQAQQAAAAAQRRARAKSVRRKRGSPPAAASTRSP